MLAAMPAFPGDAAGVDAGVSPPDTHADRALLRVSVVLIGDELLDGYVADRNAHWLAGRLAVLGIPLDRIQVVPDEHGAIAEALGLELARSRPRLVVTSGGIGSTPDDLTMEAVALHLGRRVVAHPEVTRRIDAVISASADRGAPLAEDQVVALHRMARVPEGGRVLAGSTGMVPGVVVDLDGGIDAAAGAAVVILPGVPEQFRQIVEDAVEPELLAGRGRPRHLAEFRHDHPESAFTPVLEQLASSLPDLAVGSYPGDEVVVRLKGAADDVASAMQMLETHARRLAADPATIARRASRRAESS